MQFYLLYVDLEQHKFDLNNRCLSSGWTMCQSNVYVDLILIWETSSCFVLDVLRDTWSFKIERSITVSHRESYHFINHLVLSKITSQSMITYFTKHLLKLCIVCDYFILYLTDKFLIKTGNYLWQELAVIKKILLK